MKGQPKGRFLRLRSRVANDITDIIGIIDLFLVHVSLLKMLSENVKFTGVILYRLDDKL